MSGDTPFMITVAYLGPEDVRELVRAAMTEALAKEREMRKLELLASLKRAPAPPMSFAMRAALAWDVLTGRGAS
jgi:hypothetical protein